MRFLLLIPFIFLFTFTSQQYIYNSSTFEDPRDGRVYEVVEIGGLEWMAENLNFRVEGSMCYDNHPFNCRRLGRLYYWWEANRICPDGWHLPSDEDWAKLYKSYGGNSIDAYNNMTTGPFKAKMAGWYTQNQDFRSIKEKAYFWSSSTNTDEDARYYSLNKESKVLNSSSTKKALGFSCRCVRAIE